MIGLPQRALGGSGLDVSVLALGSWRTYERMSRDDGVAVMVAAREAGITFLDDARYNDETGTAPLPTGYSEIVFGELFRAAGWVRDEVVVANKLWWEFWPEQNATDELEASLGRMGLDHVDLIYAMPPPEGLPLIEAIGQVVDLIGAGLARAWGIGNWPAPLLAEAVELCRDEGLAMPCAAQLPYSLIARDWVEGETMAGLLATGEIGLVASYSLAGGVLSGKYQRGESGRAGSGADALSARDSAGSRALADLAGEWDIPAAQLAMAFALRHPHLASLLFGATSVAQLEQNVGALAVAESLDEAQLERLRAVGS